MTSYDDADLRDLRDLGRPHEPPPELEERVVATLREEGLIQQPVFSRRSEGWRWAAAAAALLVSALAGWIAHELFDERPGAGVADKQYLLLLSEPNGLRTTKSVPELVGEYRTWARRLETKGRFVAAQRLQGEARRLYLDETGSPAVSSGLRRQAPTGFFVVRAESWDDAVALAETSPHLLYGGEIHLREIARDN